ncbi:hypothetical protein [Burkholderia vietnamiensis]|uniref:hypothetical protein n=1 Tax=Burkholderia vietnamiensis TaxID=60552 RepID=UPI001CF25055|nr:hypothetical protein [Burkholderia vietnamiensis]MCA8197336.1 hypothetical protein [Burkholderia vietnamiensis]
MADRVRKRRRSARGGMSGDKAPIFMRLRKAIGEALQQPDLQVRQVSQLELAIGTFAPSTVLKGYRVSDYPFPMCRYVSVRDGHVYHVRGATDDGEQILAYRQGFLTSLFSARGGIAVGINEEGWMGSVMIMYSMTHMRFDMKGDVLRGLNDEITTRRSYPFKRLGAYLEFMRRRIVTLPAIQNLVALATRGEQKINRK